MRFRSPLTVVRATAQAVALVAAFAALLLGVVSCRQDVPAGDRAFEDKKREIFIINTLAETVSVYHPDTGALHDDVFTVGQWPNDLLFHEGLLFVVASGDNEVEIYEESSFRSRGEIYLGPNTNPYSIIRGPAGSDTAFVVNSVSETVSVIDLAAGEEIASIEDDAHLDAPQDGAVMDGYLFVCNTAHEGGSSFGNGQVAVFRVDGSGASGDYEFVTSIDTGEGSNPQTALALPSKQELHVYLSGSHQADDGEVLILDTSALDSGGGLSEVGRLAIGGSPSLSGSGFDGSTDASTGMVYLTGTYGLSRYDTGSAGGDNASLPADPPNPILKTQDPSGELLAGVAVDPENDVLVTADFAADELVILDRSSYERLERLSTSDGPFAPHLIVE